MRKHTFKRVILGATAMSMLFAGSAFTASNTVAASQAGAGTKAITGYNVTNIQYQSTGSTITGATMDVDKDVTNASARRIQFTYTGGLKSGWYDCAATTSTATPPVYGLNCTGLSEESADVADITVVIHD